jgi:DNA-binding response OmpR family regulator
VLLAEADDAVREPVADGLCRAGFDVLQATSGADAITEAFEEHTRIDAVILDLALPGLDGLRVARRLRDDERTRRLPILAYGAAAKKRAEVVLAAGCDAFLEVPCSPSALVAEVMRLLKRRTSEASSSGA